MTNYEIYPIGKIHNNKKGFFIELNPEYIPALQGLEGFSHLNVFWWFSGCDHASYRAALETATPYKNGPQKMGIFATRSPIRPNPIALTAAQIIQIDYPKGIIQIAYIDADDNTPVLDLKPYTPSLDRVETPGVPEWCCHWPKSLEESGCFDWENEFHC